MDSAVVDTPAHGDSGGVTAVPVTGGNAPCPYCGDQIPAELFAFWSSARRLVSAECARCERRVTLTTTTLQRWCRTSEMTTT